MSSGSFDPNSLDAVLGRLLQSAESQDKALARIEEAVNKTNGRVTSLERDKWYQRGIVAAIGVGAGVAWELVKPHSGLK
jgi:hypothetical protein